MNRAEMTNTLYGTFAFLEELFSIIKNWNVDIAYSNNYCNYYKKKTSYIKFPFSR